MGYDVHITRAEFWPENRGCEITADEWHQLVEADSELRLAGYNGPHFAIWDCHPDDDEAWLDWNKGNITTKNPDDALLCKMGHIAAKLDAIVQGDDGEQLFNGTSTEEKPAGTLWGMSLIAFLLAIVAVAMLAIVIPLDTRVRQDYPVGTPMPLIWALLLVGPGAIGVLAWLAGTILAASAFLLRQPSLHLAGIALAINCGSAIYLGIIK